MTPPGVAPVPPATAGAGGVPLAMARPTASERGALAGNFPALDGVRGVAILLVLCHNLVPIDEATGRLGRLFQTLVDFGWVGVQLFFVLSGFLITSILLDTRTARGYFRAFYARRVLRIFPLYYAVLLLTFVVVPLFAALPPALAQDSRHQVWLWTYLNNWTEPFGLGVAGFPHLWSLAVEEQFYLVWPLVVRRLAPPRLLRFSLALALLALVVRTGLRLAGASHEVVYQFTVCRMDALALGAALAAAMRVPGVLASLQRHRARIGRGTTLVLFLAGLVVTRGYSRTTLGGQTLGYTVLSLVFAALIATPVLDQLRGPGPARGVLALPVLRWFGRYSYAIYLFHQPLNLFFGRPLLNRLVPAPFSLTVAVGYIAAVTAVVSGLAFLSYHGFEKHFLRLKRYFVASGRES